MHIVKQWISFYFDLIPLEVRFSFNGKMSEQGATGKY